MSLSIIDRDIQSWTAIAECEQGRLQRCHPGVESYYRDRMVTAQAVVVALVAHKAALSKAITPAQAQLDKAHRAFKQNPTPSLASSIKALVAAVNRGE